jgi:disulfide bond formation protein DsbB
LGFIPCTLCWVQRILMYPLVILLGIASYRNDRGIIPYVLPMTVLGAGLSLFHYLKQKVPALSAVAACKVGVPCEQMYINWFGFVTIPFLALVAFLLITGFLWAARKYFE